MPTPETRREAASTLSRVMLNPMSAFSAEHDRAAEGGHAPEWGEAIERESEAGRDDAVARGDVAQPSSATARKGAAARAGAAGAEEIKRSEEPRTGPAGMAAQSRSLRNSLIMLTVFCGLVVALLFAIPSLRAVLDRVGDAEVSWVLAAVGFELLSCFGYVVLFVLVFGRLGGHLSTRLSLAELAVNAVVSVGGLGGITLGAWVLHTKGISSEQVARRSVLLFMLASAVNVAAVVVIGVLMWLGLLPGSTDPLLTLLPAVAAAATILGTVAIATWAKARAARDAEKNRRVAFALRALSDGVFDALRLVRSGDPRLLGGVGYWLFDTLVLYACLIAYGRTPSFWAVAMAYLVGMLANSLPIPGGFVAVEGGLVAMVVLFGVHPATLVIAAVLTYRVIALWVPSVIGTVAFLSIRREIGRPLRAQPGGAAGP